MSIWERLRCWIGWHYWETIKNVKVSHEHLTMERNVFLTLRGCQLCGRFHWGLWDMQRQAYRWTRAGWYSRMGTKAKKLGQLSVTLWNDFGYSLD